MFSQTVYIRPPRNASNIYIVEPHQHILAAEQDTGDVSRSHKNYYIYNIGRSEVYAEIKYGTKDSWEGIIDTVTVQSGERKVINLGNKPYYVTGLVIYNNTDVRAIVNCASEDEEERLV